MCGDPYDPTDKLTPRPNHRIDDFIKTNKRITKNGIKLLSL